MASLEIIETESAARTLTYDWQHLNLPSAMQSPTWALNWWNAFRTPADSLMILTFRDRSGSLIGLAPWYRRHSLITGSTLRMLGDNRACSDFQSVLCRTDAESEVIECLVAWLGGKIEPRTRWDLLDFDGVSSGDPVMNNFLNAMASKGHVIHRRTPTNTWRLPLDGAWDRFLAKQSKSQRNQIRNFINRFEKGGYELRLASAHESQIDTLIQQTVDLHQMRWKACGHPGCFSDPRMHKFFVDVMRAMIQEGTGDVAVMTREGRPVAAHAWTTHEHVAFGYQCGRDPSEDANRVGRISQAAVLRVLCEQGMTAMDFLRGDEHYKQQLRGVPTGCQRVRVVARARMPMIRHNLWLACRDIKQRLTAPAPSRTEEVEVAAE